MWNYRLQLLYNLALSVWNAYCCFCLVFYITLILEQHEHQEFPLK